MSDKAQTKKFGKVERVIPSATDKALKYYPAEDVAEPRKVRNNHTERGRREEHEPDMALEDMERIC